ncbi:hypothetical protein DL765_001022 [Monosporascus sp. GIB2]|nr:hypothetical protein DL765_001022 [Monosporascus sp. GIB2]
MGNLFSKPKPQAAQVPTDKVIPLHEMDDQEINRAIIMLFVMRFNDMLRLNGNGKLEYHIPERFDEKRPAVAYSHVKYDVAIGDVKPLHGVDHDPLATYGCKPREPYVLADKRLSKAQTVLFLCRLAYELLRYRREERMICVPAAYVEKLRERAVSDLVAAGGDAAEKALVSEGDVLLAWVRARPDQSRPAANFQQDDHDHERGVRPAVGAGGRPACPRTRRKSPTPSCASTRTSRRKDLLTKPLGYVAGAVRQTIVEQGMPAQLETRRFLDCEATEKSGWPAPYGDSWMNTLIFSNWSKGRFFDTDFSAAVVRERGSGSGDAASTSKVGRPSYIQSCLYRKNFNSWATVPHRREGRRGELLLQPTARKGFWDKIQKAMDEDSL